MAHINDFKLLDQKCISYYKLLEKEYGTVTNIGPDEKKQKERFGFYIFMIETICCVRDIGEICNLITDTDFNLVMYGDASNDEGIDAVFIDEENHKFKLFNFKFRKDFNPDKVQSINESLSSTKFLMAVQNQDSTGLKGKIKKFADEIIEKQKSNEIWHTELYVVTNENKEAECNSGVFAQLKQSFGIEKITSIGLDTIANYMSIRPEGVSATILLDKDALMSYSEDSLSSSKSYIIRLPISDLIRITSKESDLRYKYNMEDIQPISACELEYAVLFDNVRGYLGETKYNQKIIDTLKKEPTKFFMYNNGLTITAKSVDGRSINGNLKFKLEIEEFQVVNGGQTLRTIHNFNGENSENLEKYLLKGEVLVRIFQTGKADGLVNKIAEYTNSQNAISAIDLKSLSSEQIRIEQYLGEHNILYVRKNGETGLSSKEYDYRISMEKFAQILFSINGNPEKASNQKKKIFEKYYDTIFGDESLDINKSVNIIKRYFEIKRTFEGLQDDYLVTDQKIFFILYIDNQMPGLLEYKINFLMEQISDYQDRLSDEGKKISSDARVLIQSNFKDFLDLAIQHEKENHNEP